MPQLKPIRGTFLKKPDDSPVGRLINSLAGYWLLNEGSGGIAKDISGLRYDNNNGIFNNNVSWLAAKRYGYACGFNGSNSLIYILNNSHVNITGDQISVLCWFRTNTTGVVQTLIWKGRTSSTSLQYSLRIESDNKLYFYIYDLGVFYAVTSSTISAGVDYFAAGIYDGSNLQVYLDGKANGSPTSHSGNIDSGSANLGIGCKPDGLTDSLDGLIHNAMLYNRALSVSETALLCREPFCIFESRINPAHLFVASAGTIVTPSALNLGTTLQTPTIIIDCTVTPSALNLGATLQTPTEIVDFTSTPSALNLGATLETPSLAIDSMVTPSALNLGLILEISSIFAGLLVTPASLNLGASLEIPTLAIDSVIAPAAFDLGISIETPTAISDCIVTPSALNLGATLQTPAEVIDYTATPSALNLGATLQAPTISTVIIITPSTLSLGLNLQTPTITVGENLVKPDALGLGLSLLEPTVYTRYTEIPPKMHRHLIDPYSGGAWLWLCEISLSGYNTKRIARNTEDVPYDTNIFEKFNFKIGEQLFSGDGSIPRVTLRIFQDANRVMEDLINETEGALGANIKLIRVNEDFLTTSVSALEYDYDALASESDTEWVTFTLGIPNPLTQRFPLRIYSSSLCPWATPTLFKGPDCQYAGSDESCTGNFDDCYKKGNADKWGAELGLDPNVVKI